MSDKGTEILTPVGRLVSGDCFEGQTTDAEGNPLVVKSGPNTGQPRKSYYIGLAIPKTDPTYNELWAKIHDEARTSFPSMFDAAGNCTNPRFAFKVTDGDSQIPNAKSIKPCDREGFAGHWVLHFSNGFAPKCYTANGDSIITDPQAIKRGYYVRVYGNVKGNGSMQQPGVFLNHSMVELIGYGEEIIVGPSGEAVFGAKPAVLPPGASATPLAPSAAIAPGVGASVPPTPGAGAGVPPTPGAGAGVPPTPPVAPAPDFLQPDFNVTYNGQTYSAEALKGQGWTDEQINQLPRV